MIYVLTAAIVIAWVLLVGLMARAALQTPSCPDCGSHRIESVDIRTSTITVDGAKIPAAWMYRRCHDCGARLKWDVGQDSWVPLAPGEWADVVDTAEEVR